MASLAAGPSGGRHRGSTWSSGSRARNGPPRSRNGPTARPNGPFHRHIHAQMGQLGRLGRSWEGREPSAQATSRRASAMWAGTMMRVMGPGGSNPLAPTIPLPSSSSAPTRGAPCHPGTLPADSPWRRRSGDAPPCSRTRTWDPTGPTAPGPRAPTMTAGPARERCRRDGERSRRRVAVHPVPLRAPLRPRTTSAGARRMPGASSPGPRRTRGSATASGAAAGTPLRLRPRCSPPRHRGAPVPDGAARGPTPPPAR